VVQALEAASAGTIGLAGEVLHGFGLLLTGRFGWQGLGGPITIARLSGEAAEAGLGGFIHMMALVSVNLAVLNLLPIPVLDGGHLLIFTIEAALRRRLSVEARVKAMKVGLLIVGALMIVALLNDVLGLF
jgi:regulator of sigma E protease